MVARRAGGAEGTGRRSRQRADAGNHSCPAPATASRPPRLPGTQPAMHHLGLKSWKRPLRFMAENFTAAASSSPRPRAAQNAHYRGFMVPAPAASPPPPPPRET